MRVYGELPADAEGVEAPVIDPGTRPPTGFPRRWGWLVALAVAVTAWACGRLAPGTTATAPRWLLAVVFVATLVAIAGMLLRYDDDRRTTRVRLDRGALAHDSTATVGSAIAIDGEDWRAGEAVRVHLTIGDGPVTVRWVLPPGAGRRRALPRPGDPVAAWIATDRDAVLLRYEREWARQTLDVLGRDEPEAPDLRG